MQRRRRKGGRGRPRPPKIRCLLLSGRSLLVEAAVRVLRSDRDIEVLQTDIAQGDPMAAYSTADPEVVILDINTLPDLYEFFVALLRCERWRQILILDPMHSAIYILQPRQRTAEDAGRVLAVLRQEIMNLPLNDESTRGP